MSNFTFTSHFHALEKETATHSSVLAWRIPGTGKPNGLYKAKPLSPEEVKMVNNGQVPPHREKADVIKFAASELSTTVFKSKHSKKSLDAVRKGELLYKEFIVSNDSLETVAKRHGMSKQNAHRLIQAFKVHYFDTHCVKDCISK